MNFSVIDTVGLLAAILAFGLILVTPGYALTRFFGIAREEERADGLMGVVVGLAVLPGLDSVAVRFCGLDATLGATLALGVTGLALAVRAGEVRRVPRIGLLLLTVWAILVAVEWVDFDIAGKLYQPITVFDSVKHAATTQAIFDSGAPPRDAFFLRPERASYYYFFYTLGALVMRFCGSIVDAKAAVGGLVFWTGVGAYGLVRLALARTGLDRAIPARRLPFLILAMFAAGGLDVLAILSFVLSQHYWIVDPLQWNDVQVGAWFEDIFWVPHHVTALIAGMAGLVALCNVVDDASLPRWRVAGGVVFGGLSFAASLGLSVWVTLGFVVTMAAWVPILLVERRWRAVGFVCLAGLVALIVAAPQIADLKAGRAGEDALPIALTVRPFFLIQSLVPEGWPQLLGDLVTLPLNYGIEFGVLALGTILAWRQRKAGAFGRGEFARVLVIATIASLFVGAFLRSTLFYNDLGWRVPLLALLAGTVWTIAALDRLIATRAALGHSPRKAAVPALYVLMGIGWATVLYAAVAMRAYPFMSVNPGARFIAADPATERALRVAYGWASINLPRTAVVQQNPTSKRVFAFGVYGRNQIGVSDRFGSLYGADPDAVVARLAALGPIFKADLTAAEVGARAVASGIDDLIVTIGDPVWSRPDSFVWHVKPIFASPRVRIIPVQTIEASR